jgi:hypothetical protein
LNLFEDQATLESHLYARFIPAVVARNSAPQGPQYGHEQVTHWLTCLGRHLLEQEAAGGSGTDIYLTQIWRMAGPRLPRYIWATVSTLLASLALSYAGFAYLVEVGPPRNFAAVLAVIFSLMYIAAVWYRALRPTSQANRIDLRALSTRIGFLYVIGGATLGLLIAGPLLLGSVWVVNHLGEGGAKNDIASLTIFAVVLGTVLGAMAALERSAESIRYPSQLVSQGVTEMLTEAFVITLLGASALAIALAPWASLPAGNSTTGVILGVSVALATVASSPWFCYGNACVILARRGELPLRPARFLDWAHNAGFVRVSGLAIQFRHRDFQAWLLRDSPNLEGPAAGHLGAEALHSKPKSDT